LAKESSEAGRARPNRTSGDEATEGVTARAIVLVPVLRPGSTSSDRGDSPRHLRSPEARLEEALGLAAAIDLDIAASAIVPVAEPRPATLFGSGKVEEIAAMAADTGAGLVVVDHPLTPVQQRNLEKETGTKVLDRTGLILEIFGRRARTREGTLQVELAHLTYQKGRLVRSWTHLERQRGGAGFLGGPGETQIEADRRALQDKIIRLKRELEQVRRTRDLHRAKRRKVPFPVVAIVGYTNAGKSTLFNRLTGAGVLAENMLFATLDPTLRRIRLPHGTPAILSDTVGFISDLPTHLVAAFRATLEEVIEADLVIHLRDIADPDTQAQAEDVVRILQDLGIDTTDRALILEVWNKIDLLDEAARQHVMADIATGSSTAAIPISAATGEGVERLAEEIERRLAGAIVTTEVTLGPAQLSLLDWVYRNGDVTKRVDRDDGGVSLTVNATASARDDLLAKLGAGSGA
jgi:GTP-binding protein HflX